MKENSFLLMHEMDLKTVAIVLPFNEIKCFQKIMDFFDFISQADRFVCRLPKGKF